MSEHNCKLCENLSHDRTGELICQPLMGLLWCEECKQADVLTNFVLCSFGVAHATCRKTVRPLAPDDWREGYLGKEFNGRVPSLPSCPGFVMIKESGAKKTSSAQRNLFGDDD